MKGILGVNNNMATTTKRTYKRKLSTVTKQNNKSINSSLPLPIATLDSFKSYKQDQYGKIKEVNLPEMGGKVYAKPLSSAKFRELIRITNLADLCHEAATFMANNVFTDSDGSNPLCGDYDFWMSLTPGQLTDIFNYIGDCLQTGGDEKNG